ncbi:MAG: HlyD family type I secretion periplasmic adaptor subunit [Candidatus Caenarcaniphilales bacterium]|nr:HlyD family type I secretion periplasmic adaptor subunit [Candidatus Caenarcaniphilales bacterium]
MEFFKFKLKENLPTQVQLSVAFVGIVMVGFVSLGIWFWFGNLEESVSGIGQIVPEGKLRRVMAPLPGLIENVYVKENQIVHEGDLLMELDPKVTAVRSETYEDQVAKLTSELNALKAAVLSGGILEGGLDSMHSEWLAVTRQAYQSRLQAAESDILRNQKTLDLTRANLKKGRDLLKSSEEIFVKYQNMLREGSVSETEFREYEQKVIEQRGEVAALKEEEQVRIHQLAQSKQNLGDIANTYRRELLERLSDVELELSRTKGDSESNQVNQERQFIHAPITGTIHEQEVMGEGEVVNLGDLLLSIVPIDAKLVAEVRVINRDLGYIHLGQKAALRLDALSYQRFGRLDGEVIGISPSTQQDKDGNPFYLVRIRPYKNVLVEQYTGKKYPLRSGMTLGADIITHEKNILSFFTEPISHHFDRAFRDPSNR